MAIPLNKSFEIFCAETPVFTPRARIINVVTKQPLKEVQAVETGSSFVAFYKKISPQAPTASCGTRGVQVSSEDYGLTAAITLADPAYFAGSGGFRHSSNR